MIGRFTRPEGVALSILASLSLVLPACGGPRSRIAESIDHHELDVALSRYDELAAHDGDDLELLARIGLLLLEEASADVDRDVRREAVRELSAAGVPAQATLERVAEGTGPGATDALITLGRRGHGESLRLLRGMVEHEDAEVRAASVLSLEPVADRALIFALAIETSPVVRAAATLRLGALGPSDADALALLEDRARVDPEPNVRGAAVRALGSFEASAIPALRERLSDPASPVRLAALEALVRADRAIARASIGALLAMPPAVESIEAARILASAVGGPEERPTDEDRQTALAYLRQALLASDPQLRAQAGVALVGLPGRDDLLGELVAALARETDGTAVLALARAVLRRDESLEPARARLLALASADPGRVGLSAATELAALGDAAGIDHVRRHAAGTDPELRRAAVRALARDALRPFEVRAALGDADPRVRVAAAGGIVAAYAAR